MSVAARQPLLAPGVLNGQVVAVAGRAPGPGRAAAEACGQVGAHVEQLGDEGHRVDLADEAAVGDALAAIAAAEEGLHTVVIDAASVFAAAAAAAEGAPDGEGAGPLRSTTAAAWVVARAAAVRAMIDAPAGGKLVVISPGPASGAHAGATRDALENLARTLSIEWARYGIRATTIAPGRRSSAAELASLVAYLASPAGDYFSGCVFSLGGTATA